MRLFPSAGGARWAPRVLSVLLFALLCAIVAYWALRLLEPPVRIAPSGSLAAAETVASLGPAQTLFGRTGTAAAPVAQAVASNFKVLGVIADAERGAAIISIDGGPPEAFGAGMQIDDNHKLKAVSAKEVIVLRGSEEIRLDAPPSPRYPPPRRQPAARPRQRRRRTAGPAARPARRGRTATGATKARRPTAAASHLPARRASAPPRPPLLNTSPIFLSKL